MGHEYGDLMQRQHLFMALIFAILPLQAAALSFENRLVAAAHERTKQKITYDGSYYSIAYPWGDVPAHIGVCTDVIIRSYRKLGIDLQQLIHQDMVSNFSRYPSRRIWGLNTTDTNIDHRRVPNIQTFLRRHGQVLTISQNPHDYQAGDIVTWQLPGNLPHIGIVSEVIHTETGQPLIVHNIGEGPVLDNVLFSYPITGHFKYIPTVQ